MNRHRDIHDLPFDVLKEITLERLRETQHCGKQIQFLRSVFGKRHPIYEDIQVISELKNGVNQCYTFYKTLFRSLSERAILLSVGDYRPIKDALRDAWSTLVRAGWTPYEMKTRVMTFEDILKWCKLLTSVKKQIPVYANILYRYAMTAKCPENPIPIHDLRRLIKRSLNELRFKPGRLERQWEMEIGKLMREHVPFLGHGE